MGGGFRPGVPVGMTPNNLAANLQNVNMANVTPVQLQQLMALRNQQQQQQALGGMQVSIG
jgi:hypothetical protein